MGRRCVWAEGVCGQEVCVGRGEGVWVGGMVCVVRVCVGRRCVWAGERVCGQGGGVCG